MDEALQRVTGAQLAQLMFPKFDEAAAKKKITKAVNASPGAAVGKVVFDSVVAAEWAARGEDVILVRRETNPDDLPGMIAAKGILTERGGKTSHAAVVARGMGKTCVSGAEQISVDLKTRQFTGPNGEVVKEGDVISIDGTSGVVYLGEVPVVPSPVVQYFEGNIKADADPLVAAVHRILVHADSKRRLGVEANADTPEDAERARRFGGEGIGLCRTEHMFLGERRKNVERLILANGEDEQKAALAELLAVAAHRLHRHLRRDGRPASNGPPHRPAVARVPARHHRADRQDRGRRGEGRAGLRDRPGAARSGPPVA